MDNDKFLNKDRFSTHVITYANESNCSLLESILDCAAEYGLSETDMIRYLTKDLITKLESECMASGLVKKGVPC